MDNRTRKPWALVLALGFALGSALGAGGCATRPYGYAPVRVGEAAQEANPTEATYSLVTETGEARVRVAALGITGDRLMKVRLSVERSPAPGPAPEWVLETRDQTLILSDGERFQPAYAGTPLSGLPAMELPPGQVVAVELYYPLPPQFQDESKLPRVDVNWRILVQGKTLTATTPFDRLAKAGPSNFALPWSAAGLPWYYDDWTHMGIPGW